MRNLIYILLAFTFLFPSLVSANTNRYKDVLIAGQISNVSELKIRAFPKYYLTDGVDSLQFSPQVENGAFKIRIPSQGHMFYITVAVIYSDRNLKALVHYLVEPGDSVFIREEAGNFLFSGRSAVKFDAQYAITKIRIIPTLFNPEEVKDYTSYLYKWKVRHDSISNLQIQTLNTFKRQLADSFYQVIKTDIISENLRKAMSTAESNFLSLKRDTARQRQIIAFCRTEFDAKPFVPDAKAAIYSANYLSYILLRTKVEASLNENNWEPAFNRWASSQCTPYQLIKNQFKGYLQEKILTAFFLGLRKIDADITQCLAQSITEIKRDDLRTKLVDLQRKTKGVTAYNFSLPNESGKLVSLSDFKGKAVLVDFWYTGCHWCTVFSKNIQPLVEKNDSNFVFITVSIDTDKNIWKESLRSGLYSSSNDVNLYTQGLGMNHPLIKYYAIQGFPYTIIISPQGKISSLNPNSGSGSAEILSKVTNAMNIALYEK